ncbi:MAG TPA: serine hydrolase, partial [Terriglobales bacterium]|nr:serine hydrolase [Terriglobales bacterium]
GIRQNAFPGASVAITHHGKLIALKGFGHFTYERESPEVKADTSFDLASITKAIGTTAACMLLYQGGRLDLKQPVVEVLPQFSGSDPRRSRITFEMLLAHSSGLPAYVRLFETARSREQLLEQAFAVPLTSDPGARSEYSDIGFIVLGRSIERITGAPLDEYSHREIFGPLGLSRLRFNPPADCKALIPPTERQQPFRPYVIQGEVNDENAYVMGGVAGHAGCFGAALDVATFAECMLRDGNPLFNRHTVELFTQLQSSPPGTSRALGWDTPSAPSQSGRYFSRKSFGHLGYTGTSLWIDLEHQLSVTLLTNRTWPDRGSQAIKSTRPAFHDAVVEAL